MMLVLIVAVKCVSIRAVDTVGNNVTFYSVSACHLSIVGIYQYQILKCTYAYFKNSSHPTFTPLHPLENAWPMEEQLGHVKLDIRAAPLLPPRLWPLLQTDVGMIATVGLMDAANAVATEWGIGTQTSGVLGQVSQQAKP